MPIVFCYKDDCVHRSKRRSEVKNNGGKFMYKCKNNEVIIQKTDSEFVEWIGDESICSCLRYKKINNEIK